MTLIIGKLYEINVKKSYSFYSERNKFFAFSKNLIVLFDSGTVGLYLGVPKQKIIDNQDPEYLFLIADRIIYFSDYFYEHVIFVSVSEKNIII